MMGWRGTEELYCLLGFELLRTSERLGFASMMRSCCTSLKIDGNFIFSLSVESKRVDFACLGRTCFDLSTYVYGTPVVALFPLDVPVGNGAFMFNVLTVRFPCKF